MAGSVEQGFEPHDPDALDNESGSESGSDAAGGTTYVHIDTGFFSAEAISLFDMPWEAVIEMMTEPGIGQVRKLAGLLQLALTAEDWAQCEVLGFRQMMEVIAEWSTQSQPDTPVTVEFPN